MPDPSKLFHVLQFNNCALIKALDSDDEYIKYSSGYAKTTQTICIASSRFNRNRQCLNGIVDGKSVPTLSPRAPFLPA